VTENNKKLCCCKKRTVLLCVSIVVKPTKPTNFGHLSRNFDRLTFGLSTYVIRHSLRNTLECIGVKLNGNIALINTFGSFPPLISASLLNVIKTIKANEINQFITIKPAHR